MRLRRQLGAGVAALFITALASCGPAGTPVKANWLASPEQAIAESAASGKMLLLMFTASDWSPACEKMQREILDTQAFKDFADANLVLYQADFPRKNNLDPHISAVNSQLAKSCAVEGYPTFILLDSHKKLVYSVVGYQYPNDFFQQLKAHVIPPADTSGNTSAAGK